MTANRKQSINTKEFAWDGLSFRIPQQWELAEHSAKRNITRISLEDAYTTRLEGEWALLRKKPDIENVRQRYTKQARKLTEQATASRPVSGLPQGWTAFLYPMEDGRMLAITFYLPPSASRFVFLRMQFSKEDPENAEETLRALVDSLHIHDSGLIPWTVYDLHAAVPAEFRCISTVFQAGRKELLFQWRFRRLLLVQASLASIILKDKTKEEWGADELNYNKEIRGPRFLPGNKGHIQAKTSKYHPLRFYEEIARACFRYDAQCLHDPDQDKLFLVCYNYRFKKDLHRMHGQFGPFELEPRGRVRPRQEKLIHSESQ